MRRAAIVLMPLLLLGLAGCGASDPEDAYLSSVRELSPVLHDAPDADLIDIGERVCGIFDDHGFDKGFPELVAQWKGSGVEAADIIGPAISTYCPEYADNL